MSTQDETFELYDLKVEVVCPPGARIMCGAKPGDYFVLEGEMLYLPPNQGISIYSLSAVLPLLAAKQRPTAKFDWMTSDAEVACPDPHCPSRLRITRTGLRLLVPISSSDLRGHKPSLKVIKCQRCSAEWRLPVAYLTKFKMSKVNPVISFVLTSTPTIAIKSVIYYLLRALYQPDLPDTIHPVESIMPEVENKQQLWGGRFTGTTDPLMWEFNQSLKYDKRMRGADIQGSIAYTKALRLQGVYTEEEEAIMIKGLQAVDQEWESGKFEIKPTDEDIHTANERRLSEIVGPVGGKLHTGRSRNDQCATDLRLWLLAEIKDVESALKGLIRVMVERADSEKDILMPGYTHLQRGQPIRWSHLLLSHAFSFISDLQRLRELVPRVSVLPLGSGALAGNPFGVDREFLAKELGFQSIAENSLWGVSDRDYIVEFMMWASLTMTHASRMAEDLIIYSTAEFGFIQLSDAYRPGLPSTYNKDLQEDKEPLFDSVDNVSASLRIAEGVIATLNVNSEKMRAALTMDMLATDLADYLVRKGVSTPFRETHHISGRAVALAESLGVQLSDLTLEQYKKLSPKFEEDVVSVFDFERSVEQRNAIGGTSRQTVDRQIAVLRKALE
ncbi:argininosuccinate lyase [Rhizoctonia solani AG-1 IA]|uniref:argininosuccinate lyase n=1 Tax=Thanatephorus cucumeris (strain AG1-IA) TaxID=983506 RepID=L8X3D6_THACA|nr:argininosuccinate lyase [Rhizoctonia solani AG-1 IA]